MTPPAPYLSRASLAAALEISESTVDEMVRRGVLPKPNDKGLWDWEEVDHRLQNLTPQGAVYVVGFGHYVKIGFSLDAPKRIAALQTACPERLTLYATLHGSTKTERELHARFAEYSSNGEWFRKEGALLAWIEEGCPR